MRVLVPDTCNVYLVHEFSLRRCSPWNGLSCFARGAKESRKHGVPSGLGGWRVAQPLRRWLPLLTRRRRTGEDLLARGVRGLCFHVLCVPHRYRDSHICASHLPLSGLFKLPRRLILWWNLPLLHLVAVRHQIQTTPLCTLWASCLPPVSTPFAAGWSTPSRRRR